MRCVFVVGLVLGNGASTLKDQTTCTRGQCAAGDRCCDQHGNVVNATTPGPLCKCDKDDSSLGGQQTMVIVSIVVLVGLLSTMLIAVTRTVRAKEDDSLVAQSKAALVDAKTEDLASLEDPRCAICLEPLRRHVVRPPNCHHYFHRACLLKWIDHGQTPDDSRKLTCPVCSRPLIVETLEG